MFFYLKNEVESATLQRESLRQNCNEEIIDETIYETSAYLLCMGSKFVP